MPFKCSCGSEDFYTHIDEELTSYVDGNGESYDIGDTWSSDISWNYPYFCTECGKEYSTLPPEDPETEWVRAKERQFLDNGTRHCPICGENSILEDGGGGYKTRYYYQSFICPACNATWTVEYKANSVTIDGYPSDALPDEILNPPATIPNPNDAFKEQNNDEAQIDDDF